MISLKSIKNTVDELVHKYGTNNPFELAELMGIIIRYVNLGNILGFHTRHFRCSIVHINASTTEKQQLFTCAHEIGHAVLHPNVNTPFLKSNTYFSTDRIEIEANTFAVELLFSQDVVSPITIHEATEHYDIPEQLLMKNFIPESNKLSF